MRVLMRKSTVAALVLVLASNVSAQDGRAVNESALRSLVERVSGEPVRGYMTYDFGRARNSEAISVIASEGEALDLVAAIRAELGAGYSAFVGTALWLGDEVHPGEVEVVVAPIAAKWDILRLARTDAVNYDMQTEDVINWLSARDSTLQINILQANTDTMFATLGSVPADIDSFLEELYEFCPDIVDQGTGTVEGLREMIDARVLYLWWD
jgi:hypothetical protein